MEAIGATLSSRALRRVVGRGAVARPRQAVLGAAVVLALTVAALLLMVKPWESGSSASSAQAVAQLTNRLSRFAWGPSGTKTALILATPEYLRATGQEAAAARYGADRNIVFLMTETKHDGDLPRLARPELVIGGMVHEPTRAVTTVTSAHHRLTVLVYPRMEAHGAHAGHDAAPLRLSVPPPSRGDKPSMLSWAAAAEAATATGAASLHLTWATLLALFGGLLSSMWPCLFQLTVYFVPTLAGLSAADSKGARPGVDLRIVKTAAAFVLGFVIVYTAAGAAAGFAAQSLGGTSVFWSFRRPMTIAAGVILLLTAIRLAANGRAPLACKMPIGNFLRRRLGYLGTMVLGVAFAVGCTTCFGAAIVLGMVTYVGVAGTPLSGALIMLVFALGMAIPLMIGAAAMAHVVSRLSRLEKVAPYMVFGASAIMAGFAALLLSGNYMALSNLVAGGG